MWWQGSNLLPKRRGHPLRSASKPCVRLVTSHGSSILWSIVIDTFHFPSGMSLIMTVPMKRTFIAQIFSTAFAFRGDVVNFYLIVTAKEKFTPATFSLLSLEQSS